MQKAVRWTQAYNNEVRAGKCVDELIHLCCNGIVKLCNMRRVIETRKCGMVSPLKVHVYMYIIHVDSLLCVSFNNTWKITTVTILQCTSLSKKNL